MSGFFSALNYSSINEDWRSELSGLRLSGGERVLCVTGSGARPLDLLAAAPVSVVAVDCNPAQTALLRLKLAAIEGLGYDEYAAFLGLRAASGSWRVGTLRTLASGMPAAARAFWSQREDAVARGVLYQGRWERYHARVARLVRLIHPARVRALLGFGDLLAQRAWVGRSWNDRRWRATFSAACSRPVVRALGGDPAYCARAPVPAGRRLHERMGGLLRRVLARHSFMVGLVLTGRLPAEELPPHLTEPGHRVLRERAAALECVTADAAVLLASGRCGGFDRFSLSDVGSFLDDAQLEALLGSVAAAAAPAARIVLREFLTGHRWPPAAAARLRREPALEARLARDDRSFAYDFVVAEAARG